MHLVVLLKRHVIARDAIGEVDESGVAPEKGREGVFMSAEHNNIAC